MSLDLETQKLGFRDALLLTEIGSVWMNAFTFSLPISVFFKKYASISAIDAAPLGWVDWF
jgi:hypothetical protein